MCVSLLLGGCDKKKVTAEEKVPVTKTASASAGQATASPVPEAESGKSVKPEEKAEAEKKVYGEPRNMDREYDRATLEKAYVEIDCARLKNDPAKLEAVFTKYGFNHPKLWTAAWAKASSDKEWVAKLVLAAHKACPRPKTPEDKAAAPSDEGTAAEQPSKTEK